MIPKIIHYCWFGGNSLPELALKCIDSWKKYFPDYEIKEWNETNYDVHKIAYASEAYGAKKYAFVSDYARFDILYKYGGIYFDIDVEVIKSFECILKNGGFMGFEMAKKTSANQGIACNAGLGMGCEAKLNIVHQVLKFYETLSFINPDGSYNTTTIVEHVTAILKKYGLANENSMQQLDGFVIYPIEYFAPINYFTGTMKITENTHSIHHYNSSWEGNPMRFYTKVRNKSMKIFGYSLGKFLTMPILIVAIFITDGFSGILKKLKDVAQNR
jgi:hypothetical protein